MHTFRSLIFVLGGFFLVGLSPLAAFNYTELQDNDFVSTGVVEYHSNENNTGFADLIPLIRDNISLLEKELIDNYGGEVVLVDDPRTKQEQISHAFEALSSYLCVQRDEVLEEYVIEGSYELPQGEEMNLHAVSLDTSCEDDPLSAHTKGIDLYTLEGVGTLQISSLSLLDELGYDVDFFTNYLSDEDGISLSGMNVSDFFFDWVSNETIIPLYSITPDKRSKRSRNFDAVKIIVYAETSDFPFVSGDLSLAIFAQDDDTILKITSRYGTIEYELLEEVMDITKSMFVYSIEEDVQEDVLDVDLYQDTYDTVVSGTYDHAGDNNLIQNFVYYYLSKLRKHNEDPHNFLMSVFGLFDKSTDVQMQISSTLDELEVFL